MAERQEAISNAQDRAQDAAKSGNSAQDAEADVSESAQKVSGQSSAPHAQGSGMKEAGDKLHQESNESTGDKLGNDKAKGIGSSSS